MDTPEDIHSTIRISEHNLASLASAFWGGPERVVTADRIGDYLVVDQNLKWEMYTVDEMRVLFAPVQMQVNGWITCRPQKDNKGDTTCPKPNS